MMFSIKLFIKNQHPYNQTYKYILDRLNIAIPYCSFLNLTKELILSIFRYSSIVNASVIGCLIQNNISPLVMLIISQYKNIFAVRYGIRFGLKSKNKGYLTDVQAYKQSKGVIFK